MMKLIYFIAFAFFISCNDDDIDLSGTITNKEVETEEFTRINLSGRIEAKLVRGNYGFSIETDNNVLEYINYSVKDKVLSIYINPNVKFPEDANININILSPGSNLKGISVSNKARLIADTTVLGNFSIYLSNARAILSGMDMSSTSISLNNKSVLNISGQSSTASIDVSNSSILNGGSLKTNTSFVRVTGGSLVEISASESLNAQISKFSILKYKGVAPVFVKDEGSEIIKEN